MEDETKLQISTHARPRPRPASRVLEFSSLGFGSGVWWVGYDRDPKTEGGDDGAGEDDNEKQEQEPGKSERERESENG